MNLLTIAWKSIRQRLLASSLTGLSVALGVALMVAVLVINGVIGRMFSQSGSGFDLLVGPKGSDIQLVLSAIYRISPPIENLPYRYFKQLAARGDVAQAIPLALGDTTEEGQFPIVGTVPEYFLLDYVPGRKYQVRGSGLAGVWDAVIGSEVARRNGWDIGSQFQLVHSGQDDHVHDEKFTVRGVLKATGTPNDRTCFVNLTGFYSLAGHDKPVEEAIAREADFFRQSVAEIRELYQDDLADLAAHSHEDHSDHGHEGHDHGHFISDLQKEVTAVLLVMKERPGNPLSRSIAALRLQSDLREGFQAQGVNAVQVMARLMDDLVGNIRLALVVLTGLIIAVSGIGIFVSIYNSMADRKREIAIMRALGARRQTVFSVILAESILLCLGGGLLGLLLGHGLVFVAAPIVEARSGLLIDPMSFEPVELVLIPVMVVLASLVGFLPGLTAYRTDVAEALADR